MKRRVLTCYDGPLEGMAIELYGANWVHRDLVEIKRLGERWRQEGAHWMRPEVTYVYRVEADGEGVLRNLVYQA